MKEGRREMRKRSERIRRGEGSLYRCNLTEERVGVLGRYLPGAPEVRV
jgi:hypothetical protein